MQKNIYGGSSVKTKPCVYTPPASQNIVPYLTLANEIITQLNQVNDKEIAIERLNLLISTITPVIQGSMTQ
jgi:hypothetical protein